MIFGKAMRTKVFGNGVKSPKNMHGEDSSSEKIPKNLEKTQVP